MTELLQSFQGENLMRSFKGSFVMLFLFAVLLTGCNSMEDNKTQSNTNTPNTSKPNANPPVQPADNQPADGAKRITLEEARAVWEKDKSNVIFVDTRGEAAFNASHIKGAFLLGDFMSRAGSVPKDRTIIAYCT